MESRDSAAFNLALPYLSRVNSILSSNYNAFNTGNVRLFAINLRQLYRELDSWLIIDKKKDLDEINPIKQAFKDLAKMPQSNKEAIWEKMEEIEMTLRRHLKERGMLMPKTNDPRFLFGNQKQK
jgi:hypothetical protein